MASEVVFGECCGYGLDTTKITITDRVGKDPKANVRLVGCRYLTFTPQSDVVGRCSNIKVNERRLGEPDQACYQLHPIPDR